MIQLSATPTNILISACDDHGSAELRNPVRRVFFSGALRAERQADGAWAFARGPDSKDTLHTLVSHLDRYGIEYVADETCSEMLEALAEEERHYSSRLAAGLAVKRGAILQDDGLQDELSQGFVRELTERQLQGVHHLRAVENGANFSVPGSGKTSIALAYYHTLRVEQVVQGLLVIGPASSFAPWESEYSLCFGREPRAIRVAGRSKRDRSDVYLTADQYEVLLTSYHTAARDVPELERTLASRKYLLVLDESHYIKRPVGGKLAEAVLQLAEFAERRVILTGTPMPNGLPDLWSQFTCLWPRQLPLGQADAYLRRVKGTAGRATHERVREQIAPLFYRITKSQLGLPAPRFKLIRCKLKEIQRRIYAGVAIRFLSELDEAPSDINALREWRYARTVRLLQIAVNPTLLRHQTDEFQLPPLRVEDESLATLIDRYADFEVPAKIEQACAVAREVCGAGRKVLIWSTFVRNLEMLESHLRDLNPVVIHGGVPYGVSDEEELTRERLIDRFKTEDSCKVLIANPAACAESISLHHDCHDAIYVDRSFNAAHYIQSLDRIHRLGLGPDDITRYYVLLASDTVDQVVHGRLRDKMQRLRRLVEDDLPGRISGYWGEEYGEEEERDFSLVEQHIRDFGIAQ